MDLVEGGDDSVLTVNSMCPQEQSAWGTTTKDILLSSSRTKVVGGIRFTISEDSMYIFSPYLNIGAEMMQIAAGIIINNF